MNVDNLKNSIVKIEVKFYNSKKGLVTSRGTGFFIEKNKILTCYHVIEKYEKEENIKVFLSNQTTPYAVEILDKSVDDDLAVLQIESENQYFVTETNERIMNGDDCYCHGFPEIDENNEKLKKIIDRPLTLKAEGTDKNNKIIQFKDGQVKSGFSGSPILNLSTGAVCGVICISRKTSNTLGGYGIPISRLELLNYKEQNQNEITEKIPLKNGKSFEFKMVKVDLPNKSLYVSIYPVTFEEYDLFCEDKRNSKRINGYIDKERRKVLPVVNVTWEDAMDFCKWLNENTQNNKKYRLPSSKEWEIIAYQNKSLNDIHCDKKDFCMKIGTNRGVKGIFDFLGNIEEICSNKIVKGASFKKAFNTVLNFKRESEITNLPKDEVGFRIVRDKS